ncbi:MAG: hypothetical protein K6E95_04055, partial [Lachnospiraceae bacterium]|nr:hypothetical protein [Lachnospiraceae bacterium]
MLHEFLIRKEDLSLFDNLIPEMFRDEIGQGSLLAVATFDGEIKPENLVGAVLVRARYDWQEIAWVALTDRYSRPEYAADLIRLRTECAGERGFLIGTFSEFPVQETIRADYFSCAGFSYEKIPSRVYKINTEEGGELLSFSLKEEDEHNILTLGEMPEKYKRQIEENFIASKVPLPLEVPINWDAYDPMNTLIYIRDGVAESALFYIKYPTTYALEAVFGIETPGSRALLAYYMKYVDKFFIDRPQVLIPVIMYSVEKVLSSSRVTACGEISLAWHPYEKNRKRRGYLSVDSYFQLEEKDILGLDKLDAFDMSEFPEFEKPRLSTSDSFFCKPERETEAVYERYWKKMEAASRRIGLPPMVLIQRGIALDALGIYRSGKAKSFRTEEYGFFGKAHEGQEEIRKESLNRPPVSIKEQTAKSEMIAGLILRGEEAKKEMGKKPDNGIRERAVYELNGEVIKVVYEAIEAYLALSGVRLGTGEKLSPGEQLELIRKTPEKMQMMSRMTDGYNTRLVEKMIAMIENEDDFKKALKKELDLVSGIDEAVIEAEWVKLRKKPGFENISDTYMKAMGELKKLMSQLTALSTKIAELQKREEFDGLRDIVVNEIYSSQVRTLSYYIDSTESYLQYLYDGTPIGAMAGVFIREKLQSDAPCPDPDVKLEEQIGEVDPSFKGIAPWETDCATIFLAWERMQERLGKRGNRTAGGQITLEKCREMLAALEKKKYAHPELFREPMLTTIFSELPELDELFDEARIVRDAAAELYRSGEGT